MKIAVLIDAWFPHVGGGQIHAFELAKNLAEKPGVEIEIITRCHPGSSPASPNKVKIIRLGPCLPFENIFGRLFYLLRAFIYLLPRKYDLIHVHAFSPAIPAKAVSIIKKTPIVMTIHGTSINGFAGEKLSLQEKIFLELEKIILFKIKYDAEISVSSDVKKIPNINRSLYIIPTGVDIKRFEKKQINKDKGFKIIFVGRLVRQKGLKYLIEAVEKVHKDHSQIKLVIVGTGPLKEELSKGSPSYITFKTLNQEDLTYEMLSSHLFVLPSLYEGSPIVLFEAWGAKLPVIATRVGGVPDFIKDGLNGYLVNPKDTTGLSKTIIKALTNDKLSDLGREGYKIAKSQSWEKMSNQVYGVFNKIVYEKS